MVLCPRLEDWILDAVRAVGIDVRDYSLPSRPRELHGVVNANLQKVREAAERSGCRSIRQARDSRAALGTGTLESVRRLGDGVQVGPGVRAQTPEVQLRVALDPTHGYLGRLPVPLLGL